jgi:hypothetical protein
MSVLLSWHEKVCSLISCCVHHPFVCHLNMILPLLASTASTTVQA